MPFHVKMENEKDVLFYPSSVPGKHFYIIILILFAKCNKYLKRLNVNHQERVIVSKYSSILVPISKKLPEGKEPRNLADEGFFVGKKPFISRTNINRMENRFVMQKVNLGY